jgi:hypothetical protein
VDWWSIALDHRGDDPSLVTDDALGELVKELAPHSGIVTGGGGHPSWGARMSVQAPSAVDAITVATVILYRAGAIAELPNWPVLRAEAVREDELDRELHPDMARSRSLGEPALGA